MADIRKAIEEHRLDDFARGFYDGIKERVPAQAGTV
jgi:hypothetical protein